MSEELPEYEKTWREFWISALETTRADHGCDEMTAIKRELHDFRQCMAAWSEALNHLTNGRLSKVNYTADVIIDEIEKAFEEAA